MGLLEVDESKCKQNGACVKNCITAIIRIPKGGGYPYVSPNLESICRVCGRCMAACPNGALTNKLVKKSGRGMTITYNYGRYLTTRLKP